MISSDDSELYVRYPWIKVTIIPTQYYEDDNLIETYYVSYISDRWVPTPAENA